MSIKLRPYQKNDYKNIVEAFKSHTKVLYQCPTGGGKSVIISSFISDNKDQKILFLSHKTLLNTQIRTRLSNLGLKTGFIASNIIENVDSNIIIGSIRTLMMDKRMDEFLDKAYDIIIIDEAHRVRTKGYEKVLDHLFELNPNTKLLGVTATPYRTDKKPLSHYFQTLITSDDISTLIENNYLADFITYQTKIEDIDSEVKKSGEDYQLTSLSQFMRKQKYLDHLVLSYKEKGEGKQMIIFCVDKAHAKLVLETYKNNGYNSIEYVDSDTPHTTREKILERYQNKKLQIIVCIETLTEGIDLPDTGVIQLARPTKSIILYLQMIGRGTRPKSDKSKLIILDCAGCTQEHGLLNSPKEWSLNHNVNPNHLRKKNRIIGKRTDGTFTDNEDEMDLLELLEVSPEEYIVKLGMDTAKAEEINNELLEKQYDILEEVGKYIIKYIKKGTYKVNRSPYFGLSNLTFYLYPDCTSYLVKSEQDISLYFSSYNRSSIKKLEFYVFIGEISKLLLNKKHIEFISNMLHQIDTHEESKIDINKIKENINEFKKKQFELELSNYLLYNNTIILPAKKSITWIFPRERIKYYNKIKLSKNKLNKTMNEIVFYDSDNNVIKKTVISYDKLEKILYNNWEEIKEFNTVTH